MDASTRAVMPDISHMTGPVPLPPAIAAILMARPLVLGTRQSPLAMAQAREAARRLRLAYGLDENAIRLAPVVASGDKVQDRALRDVGGKALWTRELDRALTEGTIDFAVHSMKDVETDRPDSFRIAALLPRADARDVLLGAAAIADIPRGARLGTSAPRRAAQMRHVRPDMRIVLFRGNVATRMAKLQAGEADVTLLAAAGLDRLNMRDIGMPLDTNAWLPAASQGAIGLECLSANADMSDFLAQVGDCDTMHCVAAERAFLAGLGGDCHSPVAAHAVRAGSEIHLRGELYSEDGADKVADEACFPLADGDAARTLARRLLEAAPASVAALFSGT